MLAQAKVSASSLRGSLHGSPVLCALHRSLAGRPAFGKVLVREIFQSELAGSEWAPSRTEQLLYEKEGLLTIRRSNYYVQGESLTVARTLLLLFAALGFALAFVYDSVFWVLLAYSLAVGLSADRRAEDHRRKCVRRNH